MSMGHFRHMDVNVVTFLRPDPGTVDEPRLKKRGCTELPLWPLHRVSANALILSSQAACPLMDHYLLPDFFHISARS
jgi:hypothetical protein